MVGFFFIIVLIKPSEPFEGCVHRDKNSPQYQGLHERNAATVSVMIIQPYLRSRLILTCATNFADKNERTIGALAALALALFTLYLWRATHGLRRYAGIQAGDMQQLLATARDNAAAAASQAEAMEQLHSAAKAQESALREQVIVTAALAKAAQTSADVAQKHVAVYEESVKRIQRGYLFITNIVETFAPFFGAGFGYIGRPPPYVQIILSNLGKTPINIRTLAIFVEPFAAVPDISTDESLAQTTVSEPIQVNIGGGQTFTLWSIRSEQFSDGNVRDNLRNGLLTLYCHGRITYLDIFMDVHYIVFCQAYNPRRREFAPAGGWERNHGN